MPKYLLLRYYRGGPEPHRRVPRMDHWAPEDVEAHGACAARQETAQARPQDEPYQWWHCHDDYPEAR